MWYAYATMLPKHNGKLVDLIGKRYGMWTVLDFDKWHGELPNRRAYWLCRCDCGTERSVAGHNLHQGITNSCGCTHYTHGKSHTREYQIYTNMISRCHNPKDKDYPKYGGRGIFVCNEWRQSRKQFFDDMGPRPSNKHQTERIDNDGPYAPENCRWATATEQGRNKRNNRYVTINGIDDTLAGHAERLGIRRDTLWRRLWRGWYK